MQIEQLFDFLHQSVSPFHAVHTAAQLLDAAGYTRLEEAEYWNLEPEHGYYVTRNESSIIAWRVPAHAIGGWRIAASHSDSPTWRIKNTNVNAAGCIKLNVEGYGGMIMSTWLDRPLSAAGRVLVRDEAAGTLESRLVDLDRDLLVIPSLAIHMDRTLNSGHAFNPQVDMQPLYGLESSKPFPALLAEAAGVKEEDIVDFDLSLYTRQAPTRIGPDSELFMVPRIDDLECAATTLYGFLDAAPETDSACAPVWAMFDNEEVGSSTRQGADSSFLRDVLDRILNAIPHSAQAQAQAFANSFVLSADNAHAVHPNFADKADSCNKVILGKGVVVKVNASQKYTTSGLTGAIFKEICRKNNVPVQVFANRADLPGGSTLGNLQSHTVPVPMVDIGLAQLAMHSAVETAAVADADAMVRAVAGFYRVHLRSLGDARSPLEGAAQSGAVRQAPAGGCTWATCAAACWRGFRPKAAAARLCCALRIWMPCAARANLLICWKPTLPGSALPQMKAAARAALAAPITRASAALSMKNITKSWCAKGWFTPAFAAAASCTPPMPPTAPMGRWYTLGPAGT